MVENKTRIRLPIITEKSISIYSDNWKIRFYKEQESIFFDNNGEWKIDFIELLNGAIISNLQNDYRESITYQCIPFLVAVFRSKEILLCSKGASRELFLIESIEKYIQGKETFFDSDEDKNYIILKNHIKRINSLNPKRFPPQIEKITKKYQLPDLLNGEEYLDVYNKSKLFTNKLLNEINRYKPTIFERVTDFSLNLTANYVLLRIHLLKFLAILPSLDYDNIGVDVKRIFLESFRRLISDSQIAKAKMRKGDHGPIPFYLVLGFSVSSFCVKLIPAKLFSHFIRKSVKLFAGRFIAGDTIEKSISSLSAMKATNRDATIDQLGELVVSEKEADRYCDNVVAIIKGLSGHITREEKNNSGILRANVSIKISALSSDFKPEAIDYTYNSVAPRLRKIFLAAKNENVFINMDSEHYRCRDLAFTIFKKVLLDTAELKDFKTVGIAVQAYLRDAYPHLLEVIELAKLRNIIMPIRLVKGAYWDAETIEADAFNYDAPEFLNKEESDLHFRQLIIVIMKNYPHVQLCLASHNAQDHCFAEALRELYFSHVPNIEHQCLYMTCESLSVSMANGMQWVTRNYVPVGSLIMGMGYLVRRIMENSSMAGVLTIMRSHKKQGTIDEPEKRFQNKIKNGDVVYDHSVSSLSSSFYNTTPIRLYLNNQKQNVSDDLDCFRNKLGKMYNQESEFNGEIKNIPSSSDTNSIVGSIRFANRYDIMQAIRRCANAKDKGSWARLNPIVRSSILLKAAEILLFRRVELTSLIVYESGKAVKEAIADVDEAIDFLNFYARSEVLFTENHCNAISRGLFAAIPPWNFPLAIPCGMVAAALVTGNSVLLKSSKQSPLIAQVLVDILHDSGVPENVLIHVPGSGDDIGSVLINDTRIDGIVFTGSKNVGMHINHQAGARITSSQRYNRIQYPVKVITEMGGKNAIIVTANAELDETVSFILYSCFGHAGQKCSAASRIIVDERILKRFSKRFKEACFDISVGESYKFSSSINPVISKEDKQRLIRDGHSASQEAIKYGGEILVNRINDDLPGCCVGPLVLQIPTFLAMRKESYSHKELFGPIVHVIPYKTVDQAIQILNSVEYALTAGIFSQSQDDIDYIMKRIEAGNIYVNRGCTGARVGVEPFGGFKLSGTGPKAGHDDYLAAFQIQISDHHTQGDDHLIEKKKTEKVENFNFFVKKSYTKVPGQSKSIKAGLLKIVENFERLFPDTQISEKTNFIMFVKWLDSHVEKFLHSNWTNHYVAGQLSYNDYSMIKKRGVLIAYNKIAHMTSLYNLISAISVGASVTILIKSLLVCESWKATCDCFNSSGVSRNNVNLVFHDEQNFNKELSDPEISFVIIDGNTDNVHETLISLLSKKSKEVKYIPSVHSPNDSPTAPHWDEYLKQFVFTRSMAINTMRHGAPLEID